MRRQAFFVIPHGGIGLGIVDELERAWIVPHCSSMSRDRLSNSKEYSILAVLL